MKSFLFSILIRILAADLERGPHKPLTKDEEDGLLSQMWENPAFRKYVGDRDAKLVFTMAGGEGFEPEPRDKYLIHAGQRVENLVLAKNAKNAFLRMAKMREQKASALAQAQEKAPESTPV